MYCHCTRNAGNNMTFHGEVNEKAFSASLLVPGRHCEGFELLKTVHSGGDKGVLKRAL